MSRRCPVCGRAPHPTLKPFCSERCQRVDLGRWLAGDYVVPGEELPPPGTEDPTG